MDDVNFIFFKSNFLFKIQFIMPFGKIQLGHVDQFLNDQIWMIEIIKFH
jgi:hypothetical protein